MLCLHIILLLLLQCIYFTNGATTLLSDQTSLVSFMSASKKTFMNWGSGSSPLAGLCFDDVGSCKRSNNNNNNNNENERKGISASPVCPSSYWFGIYCDLNLRVTGIVLPNQNIKVPAALLLPHLLGIANLLTLDLSYNSLYGPLPIALQFLPANISYVLLSHNNINETIPKHLALLPNLKFIYLYNNTITAIAPELNTKCNIGSQFTDFDLRCNQITNTSTLGCFNYYPLTTCSSCRPGYLPIENNIPLAQCDFNDCLVGGMCKNGGTCINRSPINGSFSCLCTIYYTGKNCSIPVNLCLTNNGGCDSRVTCTNVIGSNPICGACPPGYTGSGYTKCESGCYRPTDTISTKYSIGCSLFLANQSMCTPTCQSSYSAYPEGGNLTHVCLSKNNSTLITPLYPTVSCTGNRCVKPINNASMSYDACNPLTFTFDSCFPTCNENYTMYPSYGSLEIQCSYGSFLQPSAYCIGLPCTRPADTLSTIYQNCPDTIDHGSTCTPFCNRVGHSFTQIGDISVRCDASVLSEPTGSCQADPCLIPLSTDSTDYSSCGSEINSGSTCFPTCKYGYVPSNNGNNNDLSRYWYI